jgi:hypothetical protein
MKRKRGSEGSQQNPYQTEKERDWDISGLLI